MAERFKVRADDGRVFTVVEISSRVDVGGGNEIAGLSELRTTEGHGVSPLGDDRYLIAELDLTVRRIP